MPSRKKINRINYLVFLTQSTMDTFPATLLNHKTLKHTHTHTACPTIPHCADVICTALDHAHCLRCVSYHHSGLPLQLSKDRKRCQGKYSPGYAQSQASLTSLLPPHHFPLTMLPLLLFLSPSSSFPPFTCSSTHATSPLSLSLFQLCQ